MSTFNVVGLGTPFADDPSITLLNYIRDSYNIQKPKKDDVKFDTKFATLEKPNNIIIVKIAKTSKFGVLGGGRRDYDDVKRIQIFCQSSSAKNDSFLLEEYLEDIINANPTALDASGIREMQIGEFRDIPTATKTEMDGKPAIEATSMSHRWATIRLKYTKYKV